MKKARNVLFGIFVALTSFGALVSFASNNVCTANALDNIEYDGGTPRDFELNPGNPDDGIYFNAGEIDAPYDASYNITYYPTSETVVKLTRDGITHNIAIYAPSYPRDTLKRISKNRYYLRTGSWNLDGNYVPFIANDKVTISGTFYYDNYYISFEEASFTFDENRDIVPENFTKETLAVNGGVEYYSNGSTRGLYFETDTHSLLCSSNWDIRYHASKETNFAIARDLELKNVKDCSGDGYLVAINDHKWYADLWILGDEKFQNGDIVYFNGSYFKNDFSNDARYQFTLTNGIFIFEEIDNVLVASLLSSPATYLTSKLQSRFDIDVYTADNQMLLLEKVHEFKTYCNNEDRSFDELWNEYVKVAKYVDSIAKDKDAIKEKLTALRLSAIAEITNYVDISEYLSDTSLAIAEKLDASISDINAAETSDKINEIVDEYKTYVNSFAKRVDIYTLDVSNNNPVGATSINNEHLEYYDVVSLKELNLGNEIILSGKSSERSSNINTDETFDNDYNNTFPISKNNTTNSVAFRFVYNVNDDNMNLGLSIKLRGIRYCGYKFLLNDNNFGYYVKKTLKDGETFLGGDSNLFVNAGSYNIEVGAIDIAETDKVFIYLMVDGFLKFRVITDKTPYDKNRIDIHAEFGVSPIKEGTVSLTDKREVSDYDKIHLGRFSINSFTDKIINFIANKNILPYASNKSVNSYPLNEDAIKLIRGEKVTNVGDNEVGVLHKYSENLYSFDLSSVINDLTDGDKIVFEGTFVSFDAQTSSKYAFDISYCEFSYNGGVWTASSLSLAQVKEDALYTLNNYANAEDYTSEDYVSVKSYLDQGISQINNATSVQEVEQILSDTIKNADSIFTLLKKKQNAVIGELKDKVNEISSLYYEEEVAQINDLLDQAIEGINNATTYEQIDSIKDQFYESLEEVYTKVTKILVQLEEAKEDAKAEIRDYYSYYNVSSLSNEEIASLNKYIEEAIANIEKAENIDDVNAIKQNVISKFESIFGKRGEVKANNNTGLIIGASIGGVLLVAIGVTTIILIKRKKNHKEKEN